MVFETPLPYAAVFLAVVGLGILTLSPEGNLPAPKPAAPLSLGLTSLELQQACATQLAEAGRLRARAGAMPVNILHTANQIDRLLANVANLGYLMMNVHPESEVRTTGSACYQVAGENVTSLALDPQYYKYFKELDKTNPAMTPVMRRYLHKKMMEFKRAGVDKGPAERKRLKELDVAIRSLGQQFEANMNNDVRHIRIPQTDVAKLEQLPQDFLAPRVDSKTNEVVISTEYPDYFPVMKYARNRALRKELYEKFMNRGASPESNNIPVLLELLKKRHEYANAVGYADWASYSMEDKMAKAPENVKKFLDTVAKLSKERAGKEIEQMLSYLRADEDPSIKHLEAYDSAYYLNRVRDDQFHLNSKQIRSYFSYGRVREGIMKFAATLFGVTFKPAPHVSTWHKDVAVFDVFDKDARYPERPVGRVYLDMFPREGKYKHAASFPIREGIHRQQMPEAALVCNFPPTGPMEHADVVTFFHEFGHLLHHVIGGGYQHVDQFSGVATEWDFVEAPSQMLEEWAWDHRTLAAFAHDEIKGDSIPEALVAKMRAANEFGKGINARQQVFYATYSLELHTDFERLHASDASGAGTTTLLQDLQARLSPYPYVPSTHFQANFGHLVGYSSNYYTYMWSLVIAKDMFSEFSVAKSGMYDPDVAGRYKKAILAPGGTLDAAELLRGFLGRSYSFDPFQKWLEADEPDKVFTSASPSPSPHAKLRKF